MESRKRVALVLSSGGARGYAHIGAIEALLERGYEISSVAGASMGALIGGMYAAGHLSEVKKHFLDLNDREIFAMIDFTVSRNHLVKGDRIIKTLKEIVPDVNIEELPIPFRAIASDLQTQREVVFSKGSLYRALRASISIPGVFRPLKIGKHILVDGGVANPLPLNRIVRSEEDEILVSVNVSAPAAANIEPSDKATKNTSSGIFSLDGLSSALTPSETGNSYLSLMIATFTMLIQRNTVLAKKLTPPDIAVDIPMNRFGVFDFLHLETISQAGYEATNRALDRYEAEK